jgi:hypothetical protein
MKNKFFILSALFLFSIHLSAQCEPEEVPTAQCVGGLVVELFVVDTNGDGFPDDCIVELFAQVFNANSFDDTTPSEDLTFYFNDNPEEQVMLFNGNDVGQNNLTMYVGDTDGCVSTCTTVLILESPAGSSGYCGSITEHTLTGYVKTIQEEGIKDVEVSINTSTVLTNVNGAYDSGFFINGGGTFSLSCYKNNNPSNGVTGADLIIMRQHISK